MKTQFLGLVLTSGLVCACGPVGSGDEETAETTGTTTDPSTSTGATDPTEVEDPTEAEDPTDDVEEAGVPQQLRCASVAFVEEGTVGSVAWFVNVTHTATTTLVTGERLYSHGHPPESIVVDPKPFAVEVALSDGAGVVVDHADVVVHATTTPEGAKRVWTGTLQVADEEPLEVACWGVDVPPTFAFHYNAATGGCEDSTGKVGRNAVPTPYLRETGQGACGQLRDLFLNEWNLYYPELVDWDLRGAQLAGAKLHFADLVTADLRGTDLRGFVFGYARVTGPADEFTQVDPGYAIEDGWIEWWQ